MEAGARSPPTGISPPSTSRRSTTGPLADHLRGRARPPAGAHPSALPAPRVGHGAARHVDGPPRGLGPAPRRHLPGPGLRIPETRAPAEKLRAVAAAVRDAGVDPASLSTLDEVRDASPDAAARLDEYLGDHGWRLTTGYDIEDRCLAELPDVLLASIRSASEPSVSEGAHADALGDPPCTGARGAPRHLRRGGRGRPALLRAPGRERPAHLRVAGRPPAAGAARSRAAPRGRRADRHRRRRVRAARRRGGGAADRRRPAPTRRRSTNGRPPGGGRPPSTRPRTWAGRRHRRRSRRSPPNLARITRIILTVVSSLEAEPDAAHLHGDRDRHRAVHGHGPGRARRRRGPRRHGAR